MHIYLSMYRHIYVAIVALVLLWINFRNIPNDSLIDLCSSYVVMQVSFSKALVKWGVQSLLLCGDVSCT